MKDDKILTIFTPTYNRKELLKQLYKSLESQSDKRFIWIIIDDGSTDNTDEFIKTIQLESNIKIQFIRQKNMGKYVAYNKAIDIVDTKYFCCIDSDDRLVENAITQILNDIENTNDREIGVIYPWNNKIKYDVDKKVNIQDFKFLYGVNQENTIVFKTKYLKQVRFPIDVNEKFMSEEIIYNDIADYGDFKFINEVVVNGEYQQNGLTNNVYKLWIRNYNNTMLLFCSRFEFLKRYPLKTRLVNRCKCIINCNVINIYKHKLIFTNTPNKVYSLLLFVPSVIYLIIKRRRF